MIKKGVRIEGSDVLNTQFVKASEESGVVSSVTKFFYVLWPSILISFIEVPSSGSSCSYRQTGPKVKYGSICVALPFLRTLTDQPNKQRGQKHIQLE